MAMRLLLYHNFKNQSFTVHFEDILYAEKFYQSKMFPIASEK